MEGPSTSNRKSEKNALKLALLDCLDAGKPICDCVNIDIPDTIHCIRWHAELIDKLYERTSPSGPDVVSMIVREPIGVVARFPGPRHQNQKPKITTQLLKGTK